MKINVLPDLVFQAIPHYHKSNCLMIKRDGAYINVPWREVLETVEAIAATLIDWNVEKGDRVGILSENRAEWAYADLGSLSAGAITVPIYSTLPGKQISYILNDSELEVLFVSSAVQLQKIIDIRNEIPRVRKIVLFDQVETLPSGIDSFVSVIHHGREKAQKDPQLVSVRTAQIKPEEVFTLVYTSGTTGEPKGVMLTHHNVINNIEAILTFFNFGTSDTTLSFLPLSHIFERMAGYYTALYAGTTIAYAENIESVPKNLAEVRPTLLISVPRVYEKFYRRIMDNVANEQGLKKKLGLWAIAIAAAYADEKLAHGHASAVLSFKYRIANVLVLKKIKARLGGRLRLLISGGAALSYQLARFFYGLGFTILEGYGLTETSPVIACNRPNAFNFGTVGRGIPGVEVKIAQDGEILTRGPHIMKGYFKKPRETAEAIDADGWFHTGDIGEIDADGFVRITDRKKDLIVTSAGKNIAPQFIENALKTSKYITQIVVVGHKRNFPSALIVPNLDNLRQFAKSNQVQETEILTHRAVINEVQQEIDRLSRDLAPFERVKKIVLLDKEFTIESGELTPSLKIKRNVVEKKYKDVIDRLYSEPVLQ